MGRSQQALYGSVAHHPLQRQQLGRWKPPCRGPGRRGSRSRGRESGCRGSVLEWSIGEGAIRPVALGGSSDLAVRRHRRIEHGSRRYRVRTHPGLGCRAPDRAMDSARTGTQSCTTRSIMNLAGPEDRFAHHPRRGPRASILTDGEDDGPLSRLRSGNGGCAWPAVPSPASMGCCRDRSELVAASHSGTQPRWRWNGISNTAAKRRAKTKVSGTATAVRTRKVGTPGATRGSTNPYERR